MTVDSFIFLPRIIAFYYQRTAQKSQDPIPWQPLRKPIGLSKFALVTTGGIYNRTFQKPFDLEKERQKPTWGDPTYRKIDVDIPQDAVGVSHLHFNPKDVLEDLNILLPVDRFKALVNERIIGSLSKWAYSFMGYQGFPPNPSEWIYTYGPEVARELIEEKVDCVFMTPA